VKEENELLKNTADYEHEHEFGEEEIILLSTSNQQLATVNRQLSTVNWQLSTATTSTEGDRYI
jgi:hypothetical protein